MSIAQNYSTWLAGLQVGDQVFIRGSQTRGFSWTLTKVKSITKTRLLRTENGDRFNKYGDVPGQNSYLHSRSIQPVSEENTKSAHQKWTENRLEHSIRDLQVALKKAKQGHAMGEMEALSRATKLINEAAVLLTPED